MNHFRKMVMACAMATSAFAASVYTLDEQYSQTNQTVLRFRVENNSEDTLRNVELRYNVVQDTSEIAPPEPYYLPGGMANWTFESADHATLVIYFPDLTLYPGDTLGGISGYSIGLHGNDWVTWTKSDDPSQPQSNTFALANNVSVYSDGQPILLDAGKKTGCPVVQFVQVKNDSVSLQVLQRLSNDASSIVIRNANGQTATVNLNDAVTDSFNQKIWSGAFQTQDPTTHKGELYAECDGKLLAYFAYGWTPNNATAAVANSLWESEESFVKADFDMGFNQGLADDQRLALNTDAEGKYLDARVIGNWKFYRAWEEPGDNEVPVILSPALMQYSEDDIDSLTLEWSAVEGVEWYRLLVIKDSIVGDSVIFTDTVYSAFTMQTAVRIPTLPSGDYVWFAEPLIEVAMDEDEEDEEYFSVAGDEAAPIVTRSNSRMLKRGFFKKLKKWAKKTVKRVTKYVAPVVYTVVYGGNLFSNIYDSFVQRLNPFGVIQIFTGDVEIRKKEISIAKNMTWLQYSIQSQYVYTAFPADKSEYMKNACFGNSVFCAMKDTRMLAESWKNGYNNANWDKVFPKRDYNGSKNDAVTNRCWLTMAQMINHAKGGSVSEDEIMYAVRGKLTNVDGGGPIETMQAVNFALDLGVWDQITYTSLLNSYAGAGILPSVSGWSVGSPLLHTLIATLESGNIIGVSQLNAGNDGAHSMVINGYKIKMDGKVYIHLLNTDNMGGSEWRYYCNIAFLGTDVIVKLIGSGIAHLIDKIAGSSISGDLFFSYYIPPLYAKGRSARSTVFTDADNDGIVDFDETTRFGTSAVSEDTDGDGISDYQELYDAKACEVAGYTTELYPALKIDADGDGFCDFQEEAYVTGARNCERFDAAKYPRNVAPQCKNLGVALLAKEDLLLNDRSSCVTLLDTTVFCPIASYGTDYSGSYGVRLGVNAAAGNIYSAKSVLLRDRSYVHGSIETAGSVVRQSGTVRITGTVVENSTQADAYTAAFSPILDNAVLHNADWTITSQRVIDAGTTVYSGIFGLTGNTSFIFNSGSELRFNTNGQVVIGSVKFRKNATVYAPTTGSYIMHVGDEFQWNGTLVGNMADAAKRIAVYYYGTEPVYIQSNFAGTIIAPNADVIIGQSGKNFYGAVYAKSIVVHQQTKIVWVPFENETNTVVANKGISNYILKLL